MSERIRIGLRWMLTALLFAALGLSTSVAVAWGATAWHVDHPSGKPSRFGLNLEKTVTVIYGFKGAIMNDTPVYTLEFQAGWPTHCLRFSNVGTDRRNYGFGRHYTGAIYGGLDVSGVEYLPRQPIYTNLFLDAVFWAVVWLVLCTAGNIVRLNRWLWLRMKKRCAWCGYDVHNLPKRRCPECGRAIERWPALFKHPARWPAVLMLLLLIFGEIAFIHTFVSSGIFNPIHRAAFQGDLKTVQAELARGVDIDLMLQDFAYINCTPLILAAWNGHEDVVEHLLENGADASIIGAHGSALTAAVRSRNAALVRQMINADVPIDLRTGDDREPLIAAIQIGDADLTRTLIEVGADVNLRDASGFTPLDCVLWAHRIDREARVAIVHHLLDAGAETNTQNSSRVGGPLAEAMFAGYYDIARILIEAGAAVDDYLTLASASAPSGTGGLDLLVEYGADLSMNDPTSGLSLLWHVNRFPYYGKTDVWQMLLDHGADINSVSKRTGQSLLIDAVRRGDSAFAKFLLVNGADPMVIDKDGKLAQNYIDGETADTELKTLLEAAEAGWIAEHGPAEEEAEP